MVQFFGRLSQWGASFLTLLVCLCMQLPSAQAEIYFTDQSPYAVEVEVPGDGSLTLDQTAARLKEFLQENNRNPGARDASYAWAMAKYATTLQEIDMRRSSPTGSIREEAIKNLQGAIQLAEELDGEIEDELLFFWLIREAILLRAAGRADEAVHSCERALSIATSDKDKSIALYHLGDNLVMISEPAKALPLFQRALQLAPDRLTIYRDIVRCHKVLKDYSKMDWFILLEEIEAAIEMNTAAGFTAEAGREVSWTLHEVAEAAELYQEAWSYLEDARAAERGRRAYHGEVYDSKAAGKKAKLIIDAFHQGFWPEENSNIGSKSMVPIFIVGIPRSGSTLLESILSTHSDIATVREDSALAASVGALQEEERQLRDMFLAASGDPSEPSFQSRFQMAYSMAWRNLIQVHADNITQIMQHETSIVTGKKNSKRIVDKLLSNYKNIGVIHLLFPKAIILHIVRDPRDTVLSLRKHNFAHPRLGWTLSDKDILHEYAQYLDVMNHFKKVLPAGRILDVSYEALIDKPAAMMRRIFSRVGIKWDKNILDNFYKINRPYILTPSFLQVREGLNNKSIGIWKKYAKETKYQAFLAELKDIIDSKNSKKLENSFSFFVDSSKWDKDLNLALDYLGPRSVHDVRIGEF